MLTATVPPRQSPAVESAPAADATHHAPPRLRWAESIDRRLAEHRAWDAADAEWGRVGRAVPDAADGPHLTVAATPAPYWTEGDVARLFGLPRSVVAALAPAAVAGDTAATRQHGASPGEPLYAAERVAVALTLLGELRRRRAAA